MVVAHLVASDSDRPIVEALSVVERNPFFAVGVVALLMGYLGLRASSTKLELQGGKRTRRD